MTYNKLPGIVFTESVATSQVAAEDGNIPLFIIKATDDYDLCGSINHFDSYSAFADVSAALEAPYTKQVIQDTLLEVGATEFYLYPVAFTNATTLTDTVAATAHLDDVKNMIYIEETAGTANTAIANCIASLKTGINTLESSGVFRRLYIVPYGTVHAASNAVTSLTSILSATGDGRICCILPDENAGIVTGKCIVSPYNDEVGRTPVSSAVKESSYNFNAAEMLTLMNLGVLFLRRERGMGGYQYRICLGVTTSFKDNAADGLLVCRTVVDELLSRIGVEAQPFVKAKETDSNEVMLQSVVDAIVNEFVTNEDIYRDGTSLTVGGDGVNFTINGTIRPVRSAIAIEVNTTIQ